MIEETIQVHDQYYILATSSRIDEQGRVLKHGDTFAVLDRHGNIQRVGLGEQGLYRESTRYLSRLELQVLGRRPLLLSSTVREDNSLLMVDLANPDFSVDGQVVLPRDTVHISRFSSLWNNVRYEQLRFRSYAHRPVEIPFVLYYDADFADIFEVRGIKRARRGERLPPIIESDRVELSYRGLDRKVRRTIIEFAPAPLLIQDSQAQYRCALAPHEEKSYFFTVSCDAPKGAGSKVPLAVALNSAAEELRQSRAPDAQIESSNEQFNDWLNRSVMDLHLLFTKTSHGPYPYAGIPWYNTVFGRDGIITAMEYLWVNPQIARGVLGYLAAHQATETNSEQDAEPGKILHECRSGEMAELGEIPFKKYYGSVDATPLFVMLAGEYYRRTNDSGFIQSIWPNVVSALNWMDHSGDCDGDGFVEYFKQSPRGLVVQGWKDSADSVFHADGKLADGPVALCEVQGYAYAAKLSGAQLSKLMGEADRSAALTQQAENLRRNFEEKFWCEEISTYALALDGEKRPCRVRTSNAGHCLFTGIASPERAALVARTLLEDASFSGWGVRTVASTETCYNPMSYHNGSIWPHDNALIAAGFARYRLMQQMLKLFSGLFDASIFVDLHRMPELLCGFDRRPGVGPTLYPVACSPQSWSAAAVPFLLQSLLGLSIDAPLRQIRFTHPILPESLQRLTIRNLAVADANVDILVERSATDLGIELLRRTGDVEIQILK